MSDSNSGYKGNKTGQCGIELLRNENIELCGQRSSPEKLIFKLRFK